VLPHADAISRESIRLRCWSVAISAHKKKMLTTAVGGERVRVTRRLRL
jgi:hypothetical protein